jgi:hypothetical protein
MSSIGIIKIMLVIFTYRIGKNGHGTRSQVFDVPSDLSRDTWAVSDRKVIIYATSTEL